MIASWVFPSLKNAPLDIVPYYPFIVNLMDAESHSNEKKPVSIHQNHVERVLRPQWLQWHPAYPEAGGGGLS
jgi:hypothetical protein